MDKIPPQPKEEQRLFSLTKLAVENSTSIFILTLMVLIFGLQAYQAMPKEQFPDVDFPTIYVNTPYFGNSAADIENLVTRPLEQEIQSVDGVKTLNSTSLQDYSVIIIEFESGEDIDDASRKIKDAVDKVKSDLPNDLDSEPTVMDINLSEIPIVTVNVSGDYNQDELKNYAEFLQDEIEEIPMITSVEIKGDREREIKIEVDLLKMESRKVSFTDIEQAIASENLTMSAGEISSNNFRRAIRVVGEFKDVSDFQNLIVKSENQFPVYLKDIADVSFGYQETTSIARADGLPVLSLDVVKQAGTNLLNASDELDIVLEKARKELPDDLEVTLFNDQSVSTRAQVSNLENSIISGIILVILVLLFFLGLRNAVFVGMSIPLSMLMGIMFLSLTGVTMNIVVLFALILALGLLVDNAIVVVENIYRYLQEGYSSKDAAKYGASEVAQPIIASTATTLAAFIPLGFWPGLMGEFMKYFPMTLIIVLISSLIVALVINPVLTSQFMMLDERANDPAVRKRRLRITLSWGLGLLLLSVLSHIGLIMGDIEWLEGVRNFSAIGGILILINWYLLRPTAHIFQERFLPWLETKYKTFVSWAIRHSGLVFIGTFVVLFLAIGLMMLRAPKIEFFPSAEPQYVNVFAELPMGADIESTNEMVYDLERRVLEVVKPYGGVVEAVLTQIGENTSDPSAPPEPGASPNKARITASFVQAEDRNGVSTFEIMNEIRSQVQGVPGVQISIDKNADGPSTGKPINLEIQGEDIDVLVSEAEKLITYFNEQAIPGVEHLQADIKLGKPEMEVNINREAARRYGVSTYAIADAIRTSVFGKEVSKFKQGEDDYPVVIRLGEEYRYNVDNLLNQKITFRSPSTGRISQVPISAVASVDYTSSYSSIKRKDLDRVITVYSNVLPGYNANEIVAEMKDLMSSYSLPRDYSYEFTGEQQQQAEDMGYLSTIFMIAIFSILIILVAQFNSVLSPIVIILSVLFSTIGVFLGYAISGKTVSIIFTGVGIISLAGVVVNNAIVLIDYIDLLLKERLREHDHDEVLIMERDDVRASIIQAGATRLRPVLLTAITTILGLIPLAIGFNFNFFTLITDTNPHFFLGGDNTAIWGPMAWTVIYGLVVATVLTLVVVPVMYWLAYLLKKALVNPKKEEKQKKQEKVANI